MTIARQTMMLRYVMDSDRGKKNAMRDIGGFARKNLLAIIYGAYLNGCRRNNDCCSYDWDNYIGTRIGKAAVTARCERRQGERERDVAKEREREIGRSYRRDRAGQITILAMPLPSFVVCRQFVRDTTSCRDSLYDRSRAPFRVVANLTLEECSAAQATVMCQIARLLENFVNGRTWHALLCACEIFVFI